MLVIFEIGWMLHEERDLSRYFHHLRAAHRKGRGVLVLTGHVGSWELLAMCVAMLGYPISAIYRPLDFKPLDMFFKTIRGRFGATLYAKKKAMRPVLRGLNKGELVGILLDQNTSVQAGVFVDFFGRPACTNKGLALIALHTKAPVVPVFLIRESGGYLVEIGPEVPLIEYRAQGRRRGCQHPAIQPGAGGYHPALSGSVVLGAQALENPNYRFSARLIRLFAALLRVRGITHTASP